MRIFFGVLIVLVAHIFLFNALFKKWNAQFVLKIQKQEPAFKTFYFFITSLVLVLVFSFSGSSAYKGYLLENNGEHALAIVKQRLSMTDVVLVYRADGENIEKRYRMNQEEQQHFTLEEKDVLEVIYARNNPRICKIASTFSFNPGE